MFQDQYGRKISAQQFTRNLTQAITTEAKKAIRQAQAEIDDEIENSNNSVVEPSKVSAGAINSSKSKTRSSLMTVFYSWQADLTLSSNKYFIEKCLKSALKKLNHEFRLDVASRDGETKPVALDRDTQNVLGIPEVAATIFKKIDECNVFVADVSFVGRTEANKLLCNSNVMIELGYAMNKLGNEQIMLVMDTAQGDEKELPFDLRHRRWPLTFNSKAEDVELEKSKFIQTLYDILKLYYLQHKISISKIDSDTAIRTEKQIFMQCESQMKQNLLAWEIERLGQQYTTEHGKVILDSISKLLLALSTKKQISDESQSSIRTILIRLRELGDHQVCLDGGRSFRKFWDDGNAILGDISSLFDAVVSESEEKETSDS